LELSPSSTTGETLATITVNTADTAKGIGNIMNTGTTTMDRSMGNTLPKATQLTWVR